MVVNQHMGDPTARPIVETLIRLLFGSGLAIAVGWATLVLGDRTDAAGRIGLALGAAVFMLVIIGWRRGRRGWLQGLTGAAGLGGSLLAHFWTRLGRLP